MYYIIIINLINTNYFNFQAIIGDKVATRNEQNNNDCDTNNGAKLVGNIIPNNIDFEKSGLGKRSNPQIKPIIIET